MYRLNDRSLKAIHDRVENYVRSWTERFDAMEEVLDEVVREAGHGLVQHDTREHRDAHVDSGLEAGLQDAMDLLEGVAISLF